MAEMLIVDDEKFAVEGIRLCNDWGALGINQVHTASCADEARDIMLGRRIDILICDIEMPDEDGLSLVRWVKDCSPHTESLFLTCHSEFAYAKQAINLGTSDYLLKPVDGAELAQAVTRMLRAIKEKEEHMGYNEMYRKYFALWRKQKPRLVECFWQDLLSRRILSFGDFLERALQDAQIDLHPDDRVLPVLISIEEWSKPLNSRNQEIMEYAVKKAAEEIWLTDQPGDVITDKTGVMFAFVYASRLAEDITGEHMPDSGLDKWIQMGSRFIEVCRQFFYCSVTCYVGHYAILQQLPGLCESLKKMERNNITRTQPVLLYTPQTPVAMPSSSPAEINISEWAHYMLDGDKEMMIRLIHRVAFRLEATPNVQGKHLENLHQDTLQMIYYFLQVKGISANQVPEFHVWASAQIRSLRHYMHWAESLVSAVMEAAFEPDERTGLIQRSIRYIRQNVEEDISREDVAAHVGLNPAYLSRLFKKETGQNLIDFLIEAKMKRAQELLDTTGMTVSAIAQQVGYCNFSHFTKMFRKQFAVNPQEYRKVTKRMD
ncbi:helix-turn-helix domain-containing protein [Paenibacillus caui]|uniref:helix-turn-helix domain-containing protein n=1 Tax=Paenibacillus caui TaxID=2873927 RepID=UPI001CA88A68|nr:helix-turn-helix domain-containing protein [Paenibacillus caui]